MKRAAALLASAAALLAAPALGNDSQAAIGVGGLVLTRNDAISMDAEDLFISKDEVRVRYRYTNHLPHDVEALISFPVPGIPANAETFYGEGPVADIKALDFATKVDGQPVRFEVVEQAEVAGRNVTARLKALGWPLRWASGDGEVPGFVKKLTAAEREGFIKEGLLQRDSMQGRIIYPRWAVVTHITRHQTFPAGRSVEVTHRYVPYAGGSVAGMLEPQYRREKDAAWHLQRYCIDPAFLAAFDKRQAANKRAHPDNPPIYFETWLSYILKSGANWRGPIKDFRLTVDKGKADNLVSFCMDGVKKISPTQFEVRKTNFEPKRDLEILIAEWAPLE